MFLTYLRHIFIAIVMTKVICDLILYIILNISVILSTHGFIPPVLSSTLHTSHVITASYFPLLIVSILGNMFCEHMIIYI